MIDDKEFIDLFEETKGIALAAVRSHLGAEHHHAVDDVIQETYIRVYRGYDPLRFADRSSRDGWIYTIARNEASRMTMRLRREAMKARLLALSTSESDDDDTGGLDEDIRMMKEIISGLPEKYRAIFELLILGYSESQIADALSLRRGTVKSRIHRGRDIIFRTAGAKEWDYEAR